MFYLESTEMLPEDVVFKIPPKFLEISSPFLNYANSHVQIVFEG